MKNIIYQFQSLPTPKSFTIFPYFSLCHSNLSKGLQGEKKKKKWKKLDVFMLLYSACQILVLDITAIFNF